METIKKLFSIILIALILVIAVKVVPIYYKAYALRGICKENADKYHKYKHHGGKSYVYKQIDQELDRIGIQSDQREHNVTVNNEGVYVDIYYEDTADFFGQYYKDFEFEYQCEGVLSSPLG